MGDALPICGLTLVENSRLSPGMVVALDRGKVIWCGGLLSLPVDRRFQELQMNPQDLEVVRRGIKPS
jgi:hypothetical protein